MDEDENISLLLSMGFPDIAEIKRALRLAKNDISEAVSILTNDTPMSSFGTLNDLTADIDMRDVSTTGVEENKVFGPHLNPEDDHDDKRPSFPTTNFYELEQRVFQENWSIPYRREESLGKCLTACTRMAEDRPEGGLLADENLDKDCRKFLDSVMPEAFKKLVSSNATAKWSREIQEGIYQMLELFVDLIIVLLPQEKVPLKALETLALAFDLDNDWNAKNKDQTPMGRWQIESDQRQEQIEFTKVMQHMINNYGWLCDLINKFGDGKGFDLISDCLNREDVTCKETAMLLQPLANICDLMNNEVLGEKMQNVASTALKQVQKLGEAELKTKDAFVISDLMGALKVLCHFFDPDKTADCDKIRLQMICRMLKTPSFHTRMNGLKEVSRLIEESEQSHLYGRHRHIVNISSDELIDWMAENSVLSVALEGNIDQVQYTDRIKSIVEFLCPKLGKEDLEKIWKLHDSSFNTQIMENVHTIMASAASRFSYEQYEHLADMIKQKWETSNDRVREKLLHLIGQIGREARQPKSIQATLHLLWEVSHLETLPRHLVERALSEQLAIINEMSFEREKQRRVYINECLEDIKAAKKLHVLPAVVHLHNLCKSYSRGSSSFYSKPDKAALSELNKKHEVVKLLSSSLQLSHTWAYEEACRGISLLKKETVVDGRYTHEDYVAEHLRLMKFFLQEGDLYLSSARVHEIWDTLVDNQKAITFDRESCFTWFKECLTDLENSVQLEFFQKKLLSLSPYSVTQSSFDCYKCFIESVNVNAGKMRKNSISNLMVDVTDLIGIDYLWTIVTECSNENIAIEAIDYLLKLSFLNVSPKLKKDAAILHKKFINTCHEKLESVTDFCSQVTETHKAVQEGCELETSIADESLTTTVSKTAQSPTSAKGLRLQMIRRLINLAERYVATVEENYPGNRTMRQHATTFYGTPLQIKVIYESRKDEFFIESHTNEMIESAKVRVSEKIAQNVADLTFHCSEIALNASKDKSLVSSLENADDPLVWTVKLSPTTSCALVIYDENASSSSATSSSVNDSRQAMIDGQEKSLPGVIIAGEDKVFTLLYKMAMIQDPSTLRALRKLFHLLPTDNSILEIFDCVMVECSSDKSFLASADASPKLSPRKFSSAMNPQMAKENFFKLFDMNSPGMSSFRLLYNLEVLLAYLMPVNQVETAAQQFSHDFLRNGGLKVILSLFDKNALPYDTDYEFRQAIYTIAMQVARFLLCGQQQSGALHGSKYSTSLPSPQIVASSKVITSPQTKPTPPKKSALDASVTSQSPLTLSAYKIVQTMSDSEFLDMITCLMRVIWAASAGNLQLATSGNSIGGNEENISMRLRVTRRSRDSSTCSSTESYTGSDSGVFDAASNSPNFAGNNKQCQVSKGDVLIATEALDLLATCLQLRNHNLNSFYNLPNVSEFILEILLYSSSEQVRKAAASRLKSLALIRPSVARSLILTESGDTTPTVAKLSPRLLLTRLILKAPVPLWMPSCKARNTSHILLGQCSEYFDVRCSLLRSLSFTEQEILGENASTMLEDELTFLQNYVVCLRVEDCTLLAGHLKLVEALVSADGVSAEMVGKQIISLILDTYLFPASQAISEKNYCSEVGSSSQPINAENVNPRCDTSDSRIAAYNLLIKLAKGCPANLNEIVKFLVKAHHGYNEALAKEFLFEPLVDRRQCGYVGLKNAGATCYMNSVIQQLYTVPGLTDVILNQFDESETEDVDEETIFFQLQSVFAHLRKSKLQFYIPKKFWSVARLYGRPVNVREQQDAFEFYTQVIDQVDEYLADKKKSKVFSPFFEGVFSDQMICQGCPHRYEREQSFLALNLIVKSNSLVESLDQFVRGELLDGENAYFCEKCQEKRSTVKRMCIKTLPKTLVIQLKRFHYDYDTNRAVKFDDYFEFPRSLEMAPYTADGIKRAEKIANQTANPSETPVPQRTRKVSVSPTFGNSSRHSSVKINNSAKEVSYPYDLVGVVVHSGQANAGHYYSFIKDRHKSNTWLKFNDTTVTEFEMTDDAMKQECFGGSFKAKKTAGSGHLPENRQRYWNAYMLFYESRTINVPDHRKRGHTVSVSALPSTLPVSSRKSSTPVAPPRESLSQLTSLIDQGEKTGLFNRQRSNRMPPRIEQCIQEENLRFLLNRDIYSEEYYNFVVDLVSICVNVPSKKSMIKDNSQVAVDAVSLAVNFLLNTYTHAKQRQKFVIGDILEAVEFYLEHCSEACKYLTSFLSSNEGLRYIRPFLIECEAKEVRSAFSQLLGKNMHYHLAHFMSTDSEAINKILRTTLTLIHEDVPNHIKTSSQFFSFLHKFASRGVNQCKQLLDLEFFQGLIKLLFGIDVDSIASADVDLSTKSRRWASSQSRELGELHSVIATLVLACDNSPFGSADGTKARPLKNSIVENEIDLLPMPVCVSDVLHGKLASIYIREVVSACREVTSACIPRITESLIHVTTEVPIFSELLMEELLRQYNTVSSGDLKNLSSLLVDLLTLSDTMQPSRLDYVIGKKNTNIEGLLSLVHKHQTNDSCRAYQCIKVLVVAANKSTSVRDKLLEEAEKWQFAVNWLKEKMEEESNIGESSSTSSLLNTTIGSTNNDLMWGSNSNASNEDSLTRTFHRTTSAVVTLEEANAILAEFDQPTSSSTLSIGSSDTTIIEPLVLMDTDESKLSTEANDENMPDFVDDKEN